MKTDKEERMKIFQDTCKQFETNKLLKEATERARENTEIYTLGVGLVSGEFNAKPVYEKVCEVKVTKRSTFDAGRSYGGKVAVLNFASATNPGGGVLKGSSAQEECLCRCSNLFQCLDQKKTWDVFYTPHRKEGTALHNDDIIYTPGITVIKSDSYNQLYRPAVLDVITCAAPNLRDQPNNPYNTEHAKAPEISNEDLMKLHERRARAIMAIAADHGIEHLVVGAFGCGAYRNPPEVVAQAWKNMLPKYEHCFKTIEFAILSTKDTVNYDTFKKILG